MVPPLQSMWRSWLIVGTLVLICAVLAWRAGGPQRVGTALTSGGQLFVGVLPNLILGFALAGFLHVLLPTDLIGKWMGEGSGVKGLLVGTVGGMLTPGGPFTHFPILASFVSKGAAEGPVCAYIAAWSLIGFNRWIIWELPLLGPKIACARFLASLGFPPLIGWVSALLSRRLS